MRWGLGDFFWVWPAGLVASVVLGSIGVSISGDAKSGLTAFLSFAGQFLGWGLALVYVTRTKGRSLRTDFGLLLRWRDAWAIPAGLGAYGVLLLAVTPITLLLPPGKEQEVVDELKKATGFKLATLAIAAGILAPVFEELLYRGLLQRALRRRVAPEIAIGLAALIFALSHPLLDPTLATFAIVPALLGLGIISGIAAEWTGTLSVSIYLHVGFNLITVVTSLVR